MDRSRRFQLGLSIAATGWIAFAVSFLLPVESSGRDPLIGWQAAYTAWLLTLHPGEEAVRNFSEYLLWAGWTASNVLMALSPLVVWRARRSRHPAWCVVYGGCVLATAQALRIPGVGAGCYLWAASFVPVCIAACVFPRRSPPEGAP